MSKQFHGQSTSWAIPFFIIWTGQAFSRLGSRVAAFALVWWMTETTGSATVLATGSLLGYLPYVLLGPFAGALVDRWNRRTIMIVADGTVALTVAGLAWLFWMDGVGIGHVYAVTLIAGVAGAFQGMALDTSTSLMVPEQQLARVQGANQTLSGLLFIGGPPLGALALALVPIHTILALDVITAALAVGPLLFIHVPQPVRTQLSADTSRHSLWDDVKVGASYIWQWKGLRYLLIIGALMNFFGNSGAALIPLLISEHFGGGALQLGWFQAAFGVGLVLGGLLLTIWGGFRRRILSILVAWVFYVPSTLLIAVAPPDMFWLAWSGMLTVGIAGGFNNGAFRALMQARIEPAMQGRVFSVLGSASQTTTMLGLILAGPVVEWVGSVQFWFLAEAIVTAVLVMIAFLTPAVLQLENEKLQK